MFSGPLSHRITSGLPRQGMICFKARIARSEGSKKSTSMPRPVEVVDDTEQTQVKAVHQLVVHAVH